MTTITRSLTLLVLAAAAAAEDFRAPIPTDPPSYYGTSRTRLRISDLRLEVGIAPPLDTIKSGTLTFPSGQEHDVHHPGIEVGLEYFGGRVQRPGGYVWGVGLQAVRYRYPTPTTLTATEQHDEADAIQVVTDQRYAYAFTKELDIEVGPQLGAGVVLAKWYDLGIPGYHQGYGFAGTIGGRLALCWTPLPGLLVGLQGEYSRTLLWAHASDHGISADYVGWADGFGGQVVLGARF